MTIVPATHQDIPQILTVLDRAFQQSHPHYDPHFNRDWYSSDEAKVYLLEVLSDGNSVILVAKEGETTLGCSVGFLYDSAKFRTVKEFELDMLGVDPSVQSQGVGTQLLQATEQWAKDHGYHKISITAYWKNVSALRFYKKNGYEEIDISVEKTL
ncbi:MAG: GNAT family N-acetyltransferase [Candidatus Pacebacteria bacterium]|nr:GNAT family N-acetyltransferase [Candidatus Paceibacterota bacterium]